MNDFRRAIAPLLLCCLAVCRAQAADKPAAKPARPLLRPASAAWPDLFIYTDTCNVFVLRDGAAAILFNLGDGGVFDHLGDIGVRNVEWIIFTDHHREQCQGIGRVDRTRTQLAAPKDEQSLFETPREFRKWRPKLSDAHTVHGASYVRPPALPIKLDRLLADGEAFEWRGRRITCLATPGHSPGGMSYVLTAGDRTCAFTGGLMHDGARLTNWFDTEWDYGFGKGLDALIASVKLFAGRQISEAFPSQGPPIQNATGQNATGQFEKYHDKLVAFRPDYLRGYPVQDLTKRTKVDPILKATPIAQIVAVTPHLYKFSDMLAGKNFAIIISDRGRGLLLDCGLFPETLLHDLIREMQTHLGLKGIDALWINHMHGDHFTLGAELARLGVKIWTLDRIVDKVENPLRYDYCALITSYHPAYEGLKVDRPLRDGEVVDWEGYQVHIDWMPGQTEFGNCLWLELDGRRIAFTGDNLFGDPSDPDQNGHEAVVARNSAVFEEGYLLGSRYLRDLKPDIIMGAHNVLMTNPAAFVERYHAWSQRIIADYKNLIPDENYEYGFDPFWVAAYPYRVDLQEHSSQEISVTVRNFRARPQHHLVRFVLPPGVTAEPEFLEGEIPARSRQTFKVKIKADPARVPAGLQIVPLDITLDDTRHGQLFDFLLQATPPPE